MYRDRTKNWDYNPRATRRDGKPDTSSGSLAADHTQPRSTNRNSIADRIIHGTCNKERGDGTRDHLRPALNHHTSTDHRLGTRTFDWP